MAGFKKLKQAGETQKKKDKRPKITQLYIGKTLPVTVKALAKDQGTSISGMAAMLMTIGIESLLNGDSPIDTEKLKLPSDNFAFAYEWDMQEIERLATAAIERLTA